MAAVKQRKVFRKTDARPEGEGELLAALRTGFSRAAKEVFNLPLAVIGISATPPEEADVAALCADGPMCFVFGDGSEVAAASLISTDLVTALIRHQTIGRIGPVGGGSEPRVLTATDAALCAPLLQAALTRVATTAPEAATRAGLRDGLPCLWMAAAHDMQLALGAIPYRRITLQVDLATGAAQGRIVLLVPDRREAEPEQAEQPVETPKPKAPVFLDVRAELDAVLCRLSVPLTVLSALNVGDVVPLSGASVERTLLVGLDGQEVASAILGQLNGARAVRISDGGPQVSRIAEQGAAPARFRKAEPPSLARPAERETPAPVPRSESDFDTMSMEDAAAEITSLAGLTEEDLAEISAAATSEIFGQPV